MAYGRRVLTRQLWVEFSRRKEGQGAFRDAKEQEDFVVASQRANRGLGISFGERR